MYNIKQEQIRKLKESKIRRMKRIYYEALQAAEKIMVKEKKYKPL